jgi:tetratricopeptide (TPR) repeat protein
MDRAGAAGSSRALVAEIVRALDDGDNEAAVDLAADGLTAFPDAAVFRRLRGIALFALGATVEAKESLDAALAVDPLDNAVLIALAGVADMLGDPYAAAEYLLTAWEHDPASQSLRADLTARLATLYGPEGYLQFTRPALAALYARNAFPIRAEREYRAVIAEHPDRLDLRLAAMLSRWRLGKLTETVETCTALLAEQPHLVRARWVLADATARQGNGETAREHAKQCARYDPDGGIARALIAMNPDAAIVDPDEPIRVARQSEGHIPQIVPLRPLTTVEDAIAASASAEDAAVSDAEVLVDRPGAEIAPPATVVAPSVAAIPPAATGIAAMAALTAALANPEDVPYVDPAEQAALEATAASADQPPVPVVAVVEEGGQIVATVPGGEPALDATDALPTPPAPLPTREGGDPVGAHSRAPSAVAPTPAGSTTVENAVARARERLAAGDFAGAVAGMRGALQAVGNDEERVRTLLPALRALVDAAQRPDAHRLLGDAYRRLGLFAQAEGQYRQALLVRVAGKGAGR